jgi:alanyl-tRNA synthetase
MAREAGLNVDENGFRSLMKEQRERAKADARARKAGFAATTAYKEVMEANGPTKFVGYERVTAEARIGGVMVEGVSVPVAGPGSHVEVVMDTTPFYAESGGQLGDHGVITLDNGAQLEVYDVQSPVPGLFVHRATVLDGEVSVGAGAVGAVDLSRRMAISRAHTATHMIHKAFREALGDTATQMGSENSPGRLRFDFPSAGAVPEDVMAMVEERVNNVLLEDLPVTAEYMSQDAARKIGAMALFGEKYGDEVRVVSVGDWARELCGGTHTPTTGHIGVVKFLSEGSIGSGVRRVEALVGSDAYSFLAKEHILVSRMADLMKARPEEIFERVEGLISKLKDAEKEIEKFRSANLRANLADAVHTSEISGVVVRHVVLPDGTSANDLRVIVTELRGQIAAGTPGVVVGVTTGDAKVSVVVAANSDAIAKGIAAGALLSGIAPHIDGRGGGKPDMAQGGGSKVSGVADALTAFDSLIAAAVAK